MFPRHPKGSWYLPGLLYDLAFRRMFRGLRRRVARTVESERLYPWLDVCCGTGDQLRGHMRGHEPEVRVPKLGAAEDGFTQRTANAGPGTGIPDEQALDVEARDGRDVYGLDLSFGFLRYAKARAPRVPFVRGDAARLPFKDGSMRAVSVSLGLHDKSLDLRSAILAEARRVLGPDGRLIAVDFENPWDPASRAGTLFTRAIERFAGREHYENGRDFLRRGGLRGFLRENGFVEVARRDVPIGSLAVVVARVGHVNACDLPAAE